MYIYITHTALAVEMERWVARGLHLETDASGGFGSCHWGTGARRCKARGAAEADRADLSLAPPSPRTQALLDAHTYTMHASNRCFWLADSLTNPQS